MTLEQAILLGSTLVDRRPWWECGDSRVGTCAIGMALKAIGRFNMVTAYTDFEEIWGIDASLVWRPFDLEVSRDYGCGLTLEAFASRFHDVHMRVPLIQEEEKKDDCTVCASL